MAVIFAFTCDGQILTESNPLNFETVQAGTTSAIKTVTVTNTGTSDALSCLVEPMEATIANGFAADIQVGTAQETYLARKFAATSAGPFNYAYAVLGAGKNYANKTGGTIANGGGSDSFATIYAPPAIGTTSGEKIHGDRASCVYI